MSKREREREADGEGREINVLSHHVYKLANTAQLGDPVSYVDTVYLEKT